MKNVLLFLMAGLSLASLGALEVTVTDKDLDLPLEGVIIQGTGLRAETDSQGTAVLDLPSESLLVTFSLPGYDTRRITLKKSQGTFKVELRVSGLLEGKELVVEKAAPQKSDSQTGVAVAVTRQEMQATAQMGIVEDVMSAVKTLPGVGYTGGWNAAPSIRGGHPLETTAWMDGFEVRYPYHWGGAFSIFNPNLVENAKLSAGLVSARYGRILSGLLEITTKTPEGRDLRFDASLTTTGLEGFLQLPFTDNAGVLLGGKYSWMEVSFGLAGQAGSFNQVPYIRDAYGKAYWNPSDRLKLFVNGFFGTDGVGAKNDSTGPGLTTTGRFDWFNRSLIVSGGLKWLPTDSLHILLQGGWNGHDSSPVSKSSSSGTQNYSQAFLAKYDGSALDADGTVNGLIAGSSSFDLAGTYFNFTGKDTNDNGQARLEAQWNLAPGHSLVAGAEGSLFLSRYLEDLDGYMDFSQGGQDLYAPFLWKLENPSNYTLNSGGFLLWDFSLADDRLTGELGVRGDYTYLWNPDMSLKTIPAVNPRLRTSWTALKNEGDFQNLTFTLGGGLFSKPVFFTQMFKKDFGLQDWDFGQDRNALALLGAEAELQGGWKFSLEGYGKYYFSRHYLTMVPESNPLEIVVQKDGIGWVGGFDLLIQKKEGRWFDGYLTYSFIWARYLNPTGQGAEAIQPNGEPINQWYFPNYHRFHNLNLIGNFKPTNWLTLSVKGALATGAPRREVGTPEVFAARMPDGQLVERWKRTSVYSDSLRNDLSCPVDIKISISDYYPDSKVRWEYYFGVENVFASFYTPKTTKALDGFTGQEMSGSGEAEFTIGAPIPSFGYKLSY